MMKTSLVSKMKTWAENQMYKGCLDKGMPYSCGFGAEFSLEAKVNSKVIRR